MIIYIAGLQNIPDELEEAAYIDGVNKWQLNWHIILPLLKPALLISVFFSIIGSFQLFDLVWAISKGGPVHASQTMVTYLYNFGFIKLIFRHHQPKLYKIYYLLLLNSKKLTKTFKYYLFFTLFKLKRGSPIVLEG